MEIMDDWKALKYEKKVICIMMIHAGLKNSEILAATHCSSNTVRCGLENHNGDVEAVDSRKDHSRSSDCVCTRKFAEKLQKKVLQDSGKAMQILGREMDV